MSHEISKIIITMIACIGQIAAFCIAGYIAAVRGVIDLKCRKQVTKLNVGLFTPALLFGKVAFSLTPKELASMRAVPIGFLLVTLVSALSGWGLSSLFRVKTSQRAIIISGATFMNTNSIPVALIQSLSVSLPMLKAGPDDTPEEQLARSLSYLLIYGILGSFLRWSVGVKLFELANDEMQRMELVDGQESHKINENKPESEICLSCHDAPTLRPLRVTEGSSGAAGSTFVASQSNPLGVGVRNSMKSGEAFAPPLARERLQIMSLKPSSPETKSLPCDFQDLGEVPGCNDAPKDPAPPFINEIQAPATNRGSTATDQTLVEEPISEIETAITWKPCALRIMRDGLFHASKAFKELLNPPLVSAVTAIVVACIPPAQQYLGRIEALRHLLNVAGSVSIPLTLVALGAFFHQPAKPKVVDAETGTSKMCNETRNGRTGREIRTVILTVVSRQLIAPLILLPALACFVRYTNFIITRDPVFLMTAALVIGGPPATTLAQMTTRSCPSFDWVISRLLLWSFACVTPITTIALASGAMYIQLSPR